MVSRCRFAIVGGGLAGLASANALRIFGIEAEVFEQAPALGEIGAAVNARPQAVKARRAIGVGDEVAAVGHRSLGIYTRTLFGKLGQPRTIQKNTVSQYQKASDVVTAVALGSADAGVIYTTDWYANTSKLLPLAVPDSAQPLIRYMACVVTRPGADTAGARAVISRLLSINGRLALFKAHFGLPPK